MDELDCSTQLQPRFLLHTTTSRESTEKILARHAAD